MQYLRTYSCVVIATVIGAFHAACKPSQKASAETKRTETTATTTPKVAYDVVEGLNLGNKAPDIIQNNADGKPLSLSSLRGSVVLIDFWASWCGPCRRENPSVVKAARTYANTEFKNGKGFKVYSVSLDNNKDAWVNAIRKDSLFWPDHVCDFGGWGNAAAAKYNITTIPSNILVNGDGIIIARSLHGDILLATLKNYLK